MKESSGKTKKPSKGVRRARSLRNVVMMVLVCALMLSAATYAWFTLSKNARVANLTMTVGDQTSLVIAPDVGRAGTPGTYGSVLTFGDGSADEYNIKWALQPATMDSTGKIYSPNYSTDGMTVESVTQVTDSQFIMTDYSSDGSYYYYTTTFYMKTAGAEPVNVQLKAPTGDMTASSVTTGETGTYMINKTAEDNGAAALRIRLTDDSGNSIVYEPLSDATISGTTESATDDSEAVAITSTDKQATNGSFNPQSGSLEIKTTDTRITMQVWLEGTDPQCVNQIMADQIVGQLAFEVIE